MSSSAVKVFEPGRHALHWFYDNAVWVFVSWILFALIIDLVLRKRGSRDERVHPDDTPSVVSGLLFLVFKSICSKLILFSMSVWVYDNLAPWHLYLGDWWVWVGVFVVRDFIYYWVHRAEHRSKVLWASHMVHHSPDTINYWTALRTPWMEELYKPFIALWMPLVGFNPAAVLCIDVIIALYGQTVHSTSRNFPAALQRVLVTPSVHRVHHASNAPYIDKNFSAVFSVWDRIFGTYQEETVPVVYGLVGGQKETPTRMLMAGGYPSLWKGMRSRKGLRAKAAYVLSPPGATGFSTREAS